jgi:hypothetical protein
LGLFHRAIVSTSKCAPLITREHATDDRSQWCVRDPICDWQKAIHSHAMFRVWPSIFCQSAKGKAPCWIPFASMLARDVTPKKRGTV